jgi:hypothetical protein
MSNNPAFQCRKIRSQFLKPEPRLKSLDIPKPQVTSFNDFEAGIETHITEFDSLEPSLNELQVNYPSFEQHQTDFSLNIPVITNLPASLELWLPLTESPLPASIDPFFPEIRKQYPLIRKNEIIPVKYYNPYPASLIKNIKFISRTLYARYFPASGKPVTYKRLLYFLDKKRKSGHFIQLPYHQNI